MNQKHESTRNAPPSKWAAPVSQWGYGIVLAFCGIAAATAFLPLFPVDWWWVRIGDFPRVQLLIVYLILLPTLYPYRQKKTAMIAAFALCAGIGIQLFWIFPYLPIAPQEVEGAQETDPNSRLRILTANVLQENQNSGPLLALIRERTARRGCVV